MSSCVRHRYDGSCNIGGNDGSGRGFEYICMYVFVARAVCVCVMCACVMCVCVRACVLCVRVRAVCVRAVFVRYIYI